MIVFSFWKGISFTSLSKGRCATAQMLCFYAWPNATVRVEDVEDYEAREKAKRLLFSDYCLLQYFTRTLQEHIVLKSVRVSPSKKKE